MGRRRPWRARARLPAVPERAPFFPRLSLLPALPSTSPSSQEAASATGSAPSGSRVRHFWQLCGWALPPARFGLLLTSEPRAAGRREEDPTAPGQTRRLRPPVRPPARLLARFWAPCRGKEEEREPGKPVSKGNRQAGRQAHAPLPRGRGGPRIGVRGAPRPTEGPGTSPVAFDARGDPPRRRQSKARTHWRFATGERRGRPTHATDTFATCAQNAPPRP